METVGLLLTINMSCVFHTFPPTASNKPDTSMLDGTPLKEALELAKMPGAQNKFPTGRPDFRDAMRYVHKCWVDNFILLDGKKGPPLYGKCS